MSYDPAQLPRLLLCESDKFASVQSSAQASDEIAKACKVIGKRINLNSFAINTVLEQQDRQLLLIEAPQVESSELNDAARWKVKDMIDFNIDDAVIDVIEIPNIKELKRKPMIYAVLVKRNKITDIVNLCNSSGNNLSIIDIPDMAQRNFAALLPEDQNGVAILSINSNNSLLTVTRQGELYLSRELDTGLQQLMSNTQNQASTVESNSLNSELDLDTNSSTMMLALERMVLEIQRSLDYYEAQYSQPQINTLFLAPFPHDVSEIKDYFSTQLGIKTKMLDFNVLFATDEPISYQLQADTFFAVGVALR